MPQMEKSADTVKRKRQAGSLEKDHEPKGVTRPGAEARAWATVNKHRDGGKKIDARRKVPFGPVGGSGRKTNLARSS